MKLRNFTLYSIWLCFYILCVGLGTLTQRNTPVNIGLTALSLLFFLPGILLLIEGIRSGNKKLLLSIRIISLSSLVLTLCLIVLNILTVNASETVGQALNDLLILVSAPMSCCYWRWISLFCWACLFVSSFPRMWRK